jgi:ArsR family transcriptional regulator
MGAERLDQMLKAAGDGTRIRLLNLLRFGKICVSDLQEVLGLPQATVSRHLAVLRNAGLVMDSRRGTRIVYALVDRNAPQIEALRELLDKCCPLDERLWTDFERLEAAIRSGNCRVEEDEAPPKRSEESISD